MGTGHSRVCGCVPKEGRDQTAGRHTLRLTAHAPTLTDMLLSFLFLPESHRQLPVHLCQWAHESSITHVRHKLECWDPLRRCSQHVGFDLFHWCLTLVLSVLMVCSSVSLLLQNFYSGSAEQHRLHYHAHSNLKPGYAECQPYCLLPQVQRLIFQRGCCLLSLHSERVNFA